MNENPKRRALFSVTDKGGLPEFAGLLVGLGFEPVSTGGTAKTLRDSGLTVTEVAEVTGWPEMLGGRVKTLHPKIHGGILGRKDHPDDQADMAKYKIQHLDLVCVNLYRVEQVIAREDAVTDSVMDETDIGGVAMLRAAAKNHRDVIVVCDPADYAWIGKELKRNGDLNLAQRASLARKAFELTARYDDAIKRFFARQAGEFEETVFLTQGKELAYAENKDQNPAHLFSTRSADPLAIDKFSEVSGKASFTCTADNSGIVDILCLIAEAFRRWKDKVPYITVAGKHGNPCGVGISWDSKEQAALRALYGDTTAVMGGEVVTNFVIDDALAQTLFAVSAHDTLVGRGKWGLDSVAAPNFSESAVSLLGERERRRLLANEALLVPIMPVDPYQWRPVRGGFLRQMAPRFVLTPETIEEWVGKPLSDAQFADLIIAWACAWRASSNTVALAKNGMLIGLGCGQQDRIACVRLCLDRAKRAGHIVKESVFASDGFFPYPEQPAPNLFDARKELDYLWKHRNMTDGDSLLRLMADFASLVAKVDNREGPQLLADAGCLGGVVPGDGKEFENVKKFFAGRDMCVAFVNKLNRGFSKH